MSHALFAVPEAVWGILIAIITWLSAKGVARLSRKAADFKTRTDGTVNAGQLALNTATRADRRMDRLEGRLDRIEQWRRRVLDVWWPEHHRHDELVKAELLKLDPDADLAPAPPLPELELRPEDDAA